MRVFELAKELGIKSKELVEYLGLGSHMVEVGEDEELRVRGRFGAVPVPVFDYRDDYALAIRDGLRVLVQGGAYFSYGEAGDFDMVSSRHRIVPEPWFLGWVE